jgi:hypothetical protein
VDVADVLPYETHIFLIGKVGDYLIRIVIAIFGPTPEI